MALCLLACTPKNQVMVKTEAGAVRLQVISPEVVRVSVSPDGHFQERKSLVVLPQEGCPDYTVSKEAERVVLKTSALSVEVQKADGRVNFYRADGTPLALDGRSSFEPITVEGKKAWSTTVSYASAADEAYYGLGQQQAGELDHRGRQEELYQYNTKISVPMVVSNKGYGLLFDAYSLSRWGTDQPYKQLGEVFDLQLTGPYRGGDNSVLVQQEDSLYYENEFVIKNLPKIQLNGAKVVYEGTVTARETGDYHFIQYYAGFQRTEIGGEEKMSRRWRPAWNPNSYKFTAHLEAGVPTPLKVEWEPDGDVSYIGLRVQPNGAVNPDRLTFWSEFEPQLDYYFMAGSDYDQVIKGYRQLTGKAQVMPKWVLGFWQSRERYSTQEDLVGTLAELRDYFTAHEPKGEIVIVVQGADDRPKTDS